MSSFDDDFNQMIFNMGYREAERYARDLSSWPKTKPYVGTILSEVRPARTSCKTGDPMCTASVHAAIWFSRPDQSAQDFSESLYLYKCRDAWFINYKRLNNFSISDVLSDDYVTHPMPPADKTNNSIYDEMQAIQKVLIDFANYVR